MKRTKKERRRLQELEPNCLHVDVFVCKYSPFYTFECVRCSRRFVTLPQNNHFSTIIVEEPEE